MEYAADASERTPEITAAHMVSERPMVSRASFHRSVDTRLHRPTPTESLPLPYPNGWFALCLSSKLKGGELLSVPFMGEELLVYRTHSGQVRVTDPYCPHLGAHLGHGGKVDGEQLVCPFHGLSFAPDGNCTGAPYGRKPPCARLNQRVACERQGVLVWRDSEGRPPYWELPDIDTSGFSSIRESRFELQGQPHNSPENAADATHFMWVHHLTHVDMSHDIQGQCMEIRLDGLSSGLRARIRLRIYGIGYVCADSELPAFGLLLRSCSFGTPTTPSTWTYTLIDRVHVKSFERIPTVLRQPLYALVGTLMHAWTVRVLRDDFDIWNHRRYPKHPKLMEGEATIAAFRRWMMQFYSDDRS